MGRVLCYGVVGVDHLLQVGAYPEANGHARVRCEEVVVGGEAANTAVRLQQLGVPATLMGNAIGSDPEGDLFCETIARSGVDSRIQIQDGRSGHAYVVSDSDGHRTIFGAFGSLTGPAVSESLWSELDLVTVDPFVEGAISVAETARRKRIPVVSIEIEPGDPLASLSDTVINSAGFLRRHDAGGPAEIARALIDQGIETVIVTRGSDGADAYGVGGPWHQPVYPVPAVDTTGAGDGFRAGYIAGSLTGFDLAGRVRLATAVAALSVCHVGGCGGNVGREEALELAGLA